MSSSSEPDLQSVLATIQQDNCVSLVIVTAIVYDYILNFSREIDYVWRRPWTWVSTMYILVRYIGLYWGVIDGLAGSTFVPGPVTVSTVIFLLCSWAFPIFLGAADLVMLLRVYSMWNRSRIILIALLIFYVPQIISAFVFTGIYFDPRTYLLVTVGQVGNFAFCSYNNSASISIFLYFTLPRFIFSVVLLTFAIIQASRESLCFYRATKRWQVNQLLQLLVQDGIFYFSMNVVFNTTTILQSGPQWNSVSLIAITMLNFVSFCPLVPRFILDLREMYDRDLSGRWQGIDTAFGALSNPNLSGDPGTPSLLFAQVGSGDRDVAAERRGLEGLEVEVIRLGPMVARGTHSV